MITTKLVAVCNLSVESFSGDGFTDYTDPELLWQYLQWLMDQWADMIDIWAVSTAPWAPQIDFEQEYARLKVFFDICRECVLPFSLDTRDARIAALWIASGVQMINDVSWWRYDPDMIALIAAHPQVKYVIMYSKAPHGAADKSPRSSVWDIMEEICEFLNECIAYCISQWVDRDQLILDPGMGWFLSPDPQDSIRVLQCIAMIKERYHLPVYLGTSRKWFLGKLAPDQWPHNRLWSSLASWLYAMQQWVDYLRVHDIAETRQMLLVWNTLYS